MWLSRLGSGESIGYRMEPAALPLGLCMPTLAFAPDRRVICWPPPAPAGSPKAFVTIPGIQRGVLACPDSPRWQGQPGFSQFFIFQADHLGRDSLFPFRRALKSPAPVRMGSELILLIVGTSPSPHLKPGDLELLK